MESYQKLELEPGEFVSPTYGLCLIVNLKKLNEKVNLKKFSMETIGMFMAKLDIKNAFYSIPIH